ncbi:Cleavage induced protein [Phytophthora megakarya]|uniref:Cleavage induced protein n=1 Tax=Phytophthora megakarya TaxID=4795 RepID=A0A225VVC5_9STRA|nr:Cleavage induced protein [Phytophthora megakarya]
MASTPKHNSGDQETFLSRSKGIEDNEVQRSDSGLETMTSGLTARVPHPIFAIVNPPKVSSMARAALVDWLKLRKEYEEYTKDRCKDSKEDVSAVMKRVKSSFDANVLETLCEVCWGVDQSNVTDDFLLNKIHEITDSFQNLELPDVKELFREELDMNTINTDIDARIIEYFHLCNSLI